MSLSTEQRMITIPLSRTDQAKARTLAALATSDQQSVYQNVLAIQALQHYLRIIGVPFDPEHDRGQSLPESSQAISALYLSEVKGYLNCCIVSAKDTSVTLRNVEQNQTQTNRIGYVVVELSEDNTEAVILGFVPQVTEERLAVDSLQSLDDLIDAIWDYVPDPGQSLVSVPQSPPPSPTINFTRLRQWFKNQVEDFWQPTETLPLGVAFGSGLSSEGLNGEIDRRRINELIASQPDREFAEQLRQIADDPEATLVQIIQKTEDEAIRFKAAELLWSLVPNHPESGVKRAQDLRLYLAGYQVALMIAVFERPNGRLSILLRVYPVNENTLPPGLKLTLLDQEGSPLLDRMGNPVEQEARSYPPDLYIQRPIIVNSEINFLVKVSIGESSFIHGFSE